MKLQKYVEFLFWQRAKLTELLRIFFENLKRRNSNLSASSDRQFKENKLTLGCFRKA